MNQNIKKRWVKALRNPRARQAFGALEMRDSNGRIQGRCCLGVLCAIAVREGIVKRTDIDSDGTTFDDERFELPKTVMNWSGLRAKQGPRIYGKSLVERNDDRATFPEIADLIERHL